MNINQSQITIYNNYSHYVQNLVVNNSKYIELLDDAYNIFVTTPDGQPMNYTIYNKLDQIQKDDFIYKGIIIESSFDEIILLTSEGEERIKNYDNISEIFDKQILVLNENLPDFDFEIIVSYFINSVVWNPVYTIIIKDNSIESFLSANIINNKNILKVDKIIFVSNNLFLGSESDINIIDDEIIQTQTGFIKYELETELPITLTKNTSFILYKSPFSDNICNNTNIKIYIELNKYQSIPKFGYIFKVNKYLPAGDVLLYSNNITNFIGKTSINSQNKGDDVEIIVGDTELVELFLEYQEPDNNSIFFNTEIKNTNNKNYDLVVYYNAGQQIYQVITDENYVRNGNKIQWDTIIDKNSLLRFGVEFKRL